MWLKTWPKFLTLLVTHSSHFNTNSFNSQRQYLLRTKEPGVQKDGFRGAKFLLDFFASPQASCKENISGKEGTSQQKQPADLAESSFMSLGKCGQNKIEVHLLLTIRRIFCDSFWHEKCNEVFKNVNEGKIYLLTEYNQKIWTITFKVQGTKICLIYSVINRIKTMSTLHARAETIDYWLF